MTGERLFVERSPGWDRDEIVWTPHKRVVELEADLAAARAALERIWNEIKGDYDYETDEGWAFELHYVPQALSRLGTGEALQAIRAMLILWDEECADRYLEEPAPVAQLRRLFRG